ncbi:MAG: T9SS type A sorting domain-containing protein [Rhodothermales bacterium]
MDIRLANAARRPGALLVLFLLFTVPAARSQPVMQQLLDGHVLYHDVFGWDTAMNDRYMAISSIYPHQPDPPTLPSGSVRIYRRINGAWQFWFDLEAPEPGPINVYYGRSIDLSGGMLAVGAPLYDSIGRVFLYDLDSDTPATPVASLARPDPFVLPPLDGQAFGMSVSIDGATLVVGSPSEDLAEELRTGAVHVYEEVNGVWTHVAQFYPEAIDFPDGQYGFSVSLSGDTFVVGAPETSGATGQAELFQRRNGRWEKVFRFLNFEVNQDVDYGDLFGFSVSVQGDVIVIGAPGDGGVRGYDRAGAVYIYERQSGSWSRRTYVKREEPTPGTENWYGYEVASFDGVVAVGTRYPSGTGPGPGGAPSSTYLYREETSGWEILEVLNAPAQTYMDAFGWSISLLRNEAVVGAPWYGTTIGGVWANRVGAAYVITPALSGPFWHRVGAAITSGTDDPCDGFGTDLAIHAGTMAISVPFYAGHGGVQTYRYVDGRWMQDATIVPEDGRPGDRFGASMAFAGESLVVGTPGRSADGKTTSGGLVTYRQVDGVWVASDKPLALDGVLGLGETVVASGDWIAATARNAAGLAQVHLFDGSDGVLVERGVLTAETPEEGFGSLALAGDVLAAQTGGKEGSIRVYQLLEGTWREVQRLGEGWSPEAAIALSADRLVVGENGRVHILDRKGGLFAETMVRYGAENEPAFGASVAIEGSRIAVGAPGVEVNGKIYVFDGQDELLAPSIWKGERPASGAKLAIGDGVVISAVVSDCFEYGLVELPAIALPKAASAAAPSAPARADGDAFAGWSLGQNFPNPARGDTRIEFVAPTAGHVAVRLFDALGRQVRVLFDADLGAGTHSVRIDTEGLSEGVYFYELRAGSWRAARPMLVR